MITLATPAAPAAEGTPAAAPTPEITPTPTPSPVPSDGDRSWVPEENRADASLKDFKSPGDLARAWIAREKLFTDRTKGMVKVPGEGATPEDEAKFREVTGVPKTPAEYALDVAEDLQHLVPKDRLGEYATMFHELGVPKAQAQKIVSRYAESMQRQLLALEQTHTQAREELRKTWGEETFNRRLTLADRAIKALVSEEDQAFLQRPGIAGHPFFLRLFAQLGEHMAEDGIIESDVAGAASNQQMTDRLRTITGDKLWLSGKHPQQAALDQEYARLQRLLNPEPIR